MKSAAILQIRHPCKVQRRVWLSFLAVTHPFFPSHWSLKAVSKPRSYPTLTSTSIPDIEFDIIPETFWRSFWAHFEHAYLKIPLSKPMIQKLKILIFPLALQYILKVGHPGESSIAIKILPWM